MQGNVANPVRVGQGAHYLFHHQLGIAAVGQPRQRHDKFVATDPRHGVAGAHEFFQAAGDFDQDLVAGAVAEGIIDQLEAIQVNEQYTHMAVVAPGKLAGLGQPVFQQGAVGQLGEHIVAGVVGQLVFDGFALGNVVLYPHVMGDFIALIADRRQVQVVPERSAVFTVVAQHNRHFFAIGQAPVDGLQRLHVAVIGWIALQEPAVAAQYFGGGVAGDALEGGVYVHQWHVVGTGIGHHHAVGAGFNAALQQFQLPGVFDLGGFVGQGEQGQFVVANGDVLAGHFHNQLSAIPGAVAFQPSPRLQHCAVAIRLAGQGFIGQVGNVQACNFLRHHAIERACSFVHGIHAAAARRCQAHGRGVILEQQPVLGFAAGQVFGGDSTVDGIANAAQEGVAIDTALDQVIGGPQFNGPGIQLFIALAGQQDKRGGDAFVLRLLDQVKAGIRPQAKVNQGHIKAFPVQGGQAIVQAVVPGQPGFARAGFSQQVFGDQVVVFVVLDQQYAQHRVGHGDSHQVSRAFTMSISSV